MKITMKNASLVTVALFVLFLSLLWVYPIWSRLALLG